MGPLDPIVSNAAVDPNAQMAALLRRKADATRQAELSSGNSQMWNNTIARPQFTQTVRGGGGQPDQVIVNWGDIVGKGISNYMGAKERKTAADSKAEINQINNEFMETTLKGDPEAAKLFGAVQAGVPGAGQALTEHMEPKKQAMAVLVQGLTTGAMDPELAAQLAPQYGLDPEVVRKAAIYSSNRKQEQESDKFSQKAALLNIGIEGRKELAGGKTVGKTGYTQAELSALPIEQRIAAIQASTGRETAESKERGKLKVQAEQDLPKTDYARNNLKDMIRMASEATYLPGTFGLAPSYLDRSGKNAMLRQGIAQLVLDATGGKLGGGVSNADVTFLKEAQTNLDSGNRDTVVAQLNKLLANLENHRNIMAKQAGIQVEGAPESTGPTSPLDYTNSKNMRKSAAPSFDDVWKEVGGE